MSLPRDFLSVILLFYLFLLIACSGGGDKIKHEPSKEHGPSAAYSSTYVCPMHCSGSGSNAKGVCPGCGMNYVLLSEHTNNGHTH